MRRDFALLDGDVDDLMRPGAIARRINVRRAGLHFGIGDDAAVFRFHARVFQIQRRRVRNSAQREQNFLGGNGNRFSVLLERNRFQFSLSLRVQQVSCR